MKIKGLLLVALGICLLVLGLNMRSTQITWEERVATSRTIQSTKARNAAVGVGVGAVGGGALAAVVGGIGVAFAGTGFGLPAGAALIATGATIGGVAGGVTGAATGDSASTIVNYSTVVRSANAYPTSQWASVVAIGLALLVLAAFEVRPERRDQGAAS